MATGLYDPAYEHDACGVGMVADLHGRPDHDIVDRGLTVLERLAHRGASGAEVETGDGAGILVQVPHRFLSGAARDGGLLAARRRRLRRRASPSCPPTRTTRRRPGPSWSRRRPRRGSRCWAGAPCRSRPEGLGHTARGRHAADRAALRGAVRTRASTPMALERRAFVLRKRAEHAVDGLYFPSLSARTHRLQGHADLRAVAPVLPRPARPRPSSPAWPWCTRASRPTPSRAGRWPTRTATCATTARSTRWPGNRNWMRAREALLETSLIEGDLVARLPDLHAGGERLGQLRRGARAAAPRGPLAAARRADDDPRGVGEPHARWTATGAPSTATTRR